MANYIATDTDLTAVANAIRTKGGTSESLEFPSEFVAAIENIPSGGGGAITIEDTADSAGGTVRTITAVSLAGDTVTAAHLESGYTAHDATGAAITGTLSPGGGGGRQVIGTFTGTEAEKGTAKAISLGYTGTGYPIALQISPSVGAYDTTSEAITRIQQYGVFLYSLFKNYTTGTNAVPSYNGSTEKDYATALVRYKGSSTNPTSFSNTANTNCTTYNSLDPS